MSMLAERKRKTKHFIQPRTKPLWQSDEGPQQFGQKLMEKMGWSVGKGLGANEQGIQEPIRAIYKQDVKGMGFVEDGNPFYNLEEFNGVLAALKGALNEGHVEKFGSLEEKSSKNRTRVLYKKFTRGKDLSQYSEQDLACIVGNGKVKKIEEKEEIVEENTGTSEHSFGVTTIKGGSIEDYFRQKKRKMTTVEDNCNKESLESKEKVSDHINNECEDDDLKDIAEWLRKRKKSEERKKRKDDLNILISSEKIEEKKKIKNERVEQENGEIESSDNFNKEQVVNSKENEKNNSKNCEKGKYVNIKAFKGANLEKIKGYRYHVN